MAGGTLDSLGGKSKGNFNPFPTPWWIGGTLTRWTKAFYPTLPTHLPLVPPKNISPLTIRFPGMALYTRTGRQRQDEDSCDSIRQQQRRRGATEPCSPWGYRKSTPLHVHHVLCIYPDGLCMLMLCKSGSRGMATSKH